MILIVAIVCVLAWIVPWDDAFDAGGEFAKHAPSKDCQGVNSDGDKWLMPISKSVDGTVTKYRCTAPGCRKTHDVSDLHSAGQCNMKYADEG